MTDSLKRQMAARNAATEGIELRTQLRDHLLALSYRAYAECVGELLSAIGYRRVMLTDRRHRRGRTREGGRDLEAELAVGLSRGRVVLQLKQYGRPVQRRFVDELRGMMARTGAAHGLIVTTSGFPRRARETAAQGNLKDVLPVRLVDGEELLDLLIAHRLGVSAASDGGVQFDAAFFDRLAAVYPPSPAELRAVRRSPPTSSAHAVHRQLPSSTPNRPTRPMVWQTHLLAGVGSLWLLALVPNGVPSDQLAPIAMAAALGALMPDLDTSHSKLAAVEVGGIRPFAPVASLAEGHFGHRGLLHSCGGLFVMVALAAPAALWVDWRILVSAALGYASHLILDALTVSGVPRFGSAVRVHLLPRRFRLRTGAPAEEVVFVLAALAALLFLLVHLPHS